jgi:hypothetical protein
MSDANITLLRRAAEAGSWQEKLNLYIALKRADALPPIQPLDSDWEYVFAQEVTFKVEDIEYVFAEHNYSPEGYGSWNGCMVVALKDGRFGTADGWCDTTGWDCQRGTDSAVAATLEEIVKGKVSQEWRRALGLLIPEDA